MAPGITPSSAAANANRCGTSVPDEPPTAVNGFGSQWFNEHGVAAQAPPSDTFGYAGIAFNHQSAQINALNNNSTQIYLSGTVQCATVGGIGNAPNAGEYPIKGRPRSSGPHCRRRAETRPKARAGGPPSPQASATTTTPDGPTPSTNPLNRTWRGSRPGGSN